MMIVAGLLGLEEGALRNQGDRADAWELSKSQSWKRGRQKVYIFGATKEVVKVRAPRWKNALYTMGWSECRSGWGICHQLCSTPFSSPINGSLLLYNCIEI